LWLVLSCCAQCDTNLLLPFRCHSMSEQLTILPCSFICLFLVSLYIISRITAWSFKIFGIQKCNKDYKAISVSVEMERPNSRYVARWFAFLRPLQLKILNIYRIVSYFNSFLWALSTLRTAMISFVIVLTMRPSGRPHGTTRHPLTDC